MELAIIETQDGLEAWRRGSPPSARLAFVPTMGALHAGHISLVESAKKHASHVMVSIFVNPTQFGPNEDFEKYPRTLEADLALLNEAGVSAVFVPPVSCIYPQGFATNISVGKLGSRWCGAARPGHFDGVATVVARLFGLVKPDVAVFGEKDFQQLAIIKRMALDLALGVEIIGAPIMREEDGLAMSSRNRYLVEKERAIAPAMHAILQQLSAQLSTLGEQADTQAIQAMLEAAKNDLFKAGFSKVDYLALVDAESLEPLESLKSPARLLAAAWLGTTRLIDNIEVM